MTTPSKARVAVLICATFMVWPAIHRGIAAAYDTNAWKLGGFAMYATPPARNRVVIVEKIDRYNATLPDNSLTAELLEERNRYLNRRSVLGSLLSPDALAKTYFDSRPGAKKIEVRITRQMLDASTARIESRTSVYAYDRPDG